MSRPAPETWVTAAAVCAVGALVAWMAQGNQTGFWRGWWIGTRWAYVLGASVFLILAAVLR